jgi:hypothetical protein
MADHEPGHVAEAAKEAAAVQAVELAAACLMFILAVAAQLGQREASAPDFMTGPRARWAKSAETGWAVAAGMCWRRAERFRVHYEQVTRGW